MATDVSDEALERLCENLWSELDRYIPPVTSGTWADGYRGHYPPEIRAFARRIRDLTAARCVEVCEDVIAQAESGHGIEMASFGAEKCASAILTIFPGAKP